MQQKSKGFTLIELMVVVAIIAILAMVAVPTYRYLVDESRASEAPDKLRAIADSAVVYYNTDHIFKGDWSNKMQGVYPGCGAQGNAACGGSYLPATAIPANTSVAVGSDSFARSEFDVPPWSSLGFALQGKTWVRYGYKTNNNMTEFTSVAHLPLSDTSRIAFRVTGDNMGVVSSIIRCDDSTMCNL